MDAAKKKHLIEQVRRWLTEHRSSRLAVLAANARNLDRRGRVVKRFRTKLVEGLLAKSGVDTQKLKRLQEKDLASMRRHLDAEEKVLRQEAKGARSELRQFIRRIRTSKRRFEYQGGNPVLTVCLWFADDINFQLPLQTVGTSVLGSVTPLGTLGRNTAKVSVAAQANGAWYPAIVLPIDFTFIWQSDRSGWLRAESWVSPNGIYRLEAPSTCSGDSMATARLAAHMTLAQVDPDGELFPLGQSAVVQLVDDSAEGISSWGKGVIGGTWPTESVTREASLSGPYGVPILAGYPVVAVVTVMMSVSAYDSGSSSLDCRSGNLELTVPSVWLTVES